MESLPWDHISSGSGWTVAVGLGIYIVRQISTGNWVTRREYEDRLAESRIKDQQIAEKDRQLRHLEEVGRTVNAVMRSLKRRAASKDGP